MFKNTPFNYHEQMKAPSGILFPLFSGAHPPITKRWDAKPKPSYQSETKAIEEDEEPDKVKDGFKS